MARNHLEALQKQRVRLDKRITTGITLGGWMVLVMLLLLVWHLFVVTQPILSKPYVEFRHSWQVPSQHQFLHASKVNNSYLYFWQDDNCNIGYSNLVPDGIAAESNAEAQNVVKAVSGFTSTAHKCSEHSSSFSQKIHIQRDIIYIAQINQQNLLRISLLDFANQKNKTQVFSTRVPDDINFKKRGQSTPSWQFHVTQDSVLLLAESRSADWRLLEFELNSREILRNEPLNLALQSKQQNLPMLLANNELVMVYQDNELRLLSDWGMSASGQQQDNWSVISRPRQILQAVSLPTQRSFLLVTQDLQLEKWSLINVEGRLRLQHIYSLTLEGNRFNSLSHVDKDLALVSVDDILYYINATTGEISSTQEHNPGAEHVVVGKDIYFRDGKNVAHWQVMNASAVISTLSLWGAIWYDGYPAPEYVWQTSSATDEHQAKYSLVPLIMGSIKAAFLALLVAIPLAIGSAIYCAFYAGTKLRKVIKPWVETLEAVPSVVIGFVAAIWLLPVSENYIVGLFLFVTLIPFILMSFIWLNENFKHKDVKGWELLFFGAFAAVYVLIFEHFLASGGVVASWFWGADKGAILSTEFKHTFVLALALGIAIVPAIFTIAEDAIYQVPKKLTLASYAMGATKAQTLTRVVLKVALPGIFSAVMLGFARAIGETMIVLMVSGNTPIADWGLLEGMRTMTANLAIELPEAQPGDVHYQILFLVALLLFVFTFVFNTLAELLRLKLRGHNRL